MAWGARVRFIVCAAALTQAASAVAQGVIDGPVLLAPGASVYVIEMANPGVAGVVTAPSHAALDLSSLLAALGKGDPFAVLFSGQAAGAKAMIANPDGSVSLRAAQTPPPTVSMMRAGSYVMGGGVILVERNGKLEIRSDQVRKVTSDEQVREPKASQ